MSRRCECCDRKCPAHPRSRCKARASTILYRIDMEDESGTRFCKPCADDALPHGVFDYEDWVRLRNGLFAAVHSYLRVVRPEVVLPEETPALRWRVCEVQETETTP